MLRESLEARGWSPNQAFAAGGVTAGMLASVLTHPAGEHFRLYMSSYSHSRLIAHQSSAWARDAAGLLTWVLTAQQVACVLCCMSLAASAARHGWAQPVTPRAHWQPACRQHVHLMSKEGRQCPLRAKPFLLWLALPKPPSRQGLHSQQHYPCAADTIKTRMQASLEPGARPEFATALSTLRYILDKEGVRGVFSGMVARSTRIIGATFLLNIVRNQLIDIAETAKAKVK